MRQAKIETCLICNKDCKRLGKHVLVHNLNAKSYYDKYLKKDNEGICPMCGKPTPFLGISIGYQKHCSARCGLDNPETRENFEQSMLKNHGVKYSSQSKELLAKSKQTKKERYNNENFNNRDKAKQTCLDRYGTDSAARLDSTKEKIKQTNLKRRGVEHVLQDKKIIQKGKNTKLEKYGSETYNNQEKSKQTCLKKYGTEHVLQAKEVREKIETTNLERYNTKCTLQSDKVRQQLIDYYQTNYGVNWYVETDEFKEKSKQTTLSKDDSIDTKWRSKFEDTLIQAIQSVSKTKVTHNNKKIIYPKELDIYLPELKIAIEFNGLLYHSTAFNSCKEYHLNKSLLCREKGIRLIHIYEFEDLNEQIELLKSLILGEDKYPKNDFNKNNLINNIPEPEVIYDNGRLVIYGAGKLY